MKIHILTEADVHADGVHCGEDCQYATTHKYCSLYCANRSNNMRLNACLAAQKEAEGGVWPQDYPNWGGRYVVERDGVLDFIAIANPAGWFDRRAVNIRGYRDGDRFHPVPQPQEANDGKN